MKTLNQLSQGKLTYLGIAASVIYGIAVTLYPEYEFDAVWVGIAGLTGVGLRRAVKKAATENTKLVKEIVDATRVPVMMEKPKHPLDEYRLAADKIKELRQYETMIEELLKDPKVVHLSHGEQSKIEAEDPMERLRKKINAFEGNSGTNPNPYPPII